MKSTTNYGYSLPDYTDNADIQVLNDNYIAIDAKQKEIDDKLEEANKLKDIVDTNASNAANSAKLSQSYAVGNSGSNRTGEDTDNAKYYSTIAQSNASKVTSSVNDAKTYATNAANSASEAKKAASAATGGLSDQVSANQKAIEALQAFGFSVDSQGYICQND